MNKIILLFAFSYSFAIFGMKNKEIVVQKTTKDVSRVAIIQYLCSR